MIYNISMFFKNNWTLIKGIIFILIALEGINMFRYWFTYIRDTTRRAKFVLDNEKKGKQGERMVAKELQNKKYDNSYVFNDVYLKEDGKIIAQVDHILVSPKGIYVIETKNWQGAVKNLDFNTLILHNGKEYRTYKPTNQNRKHKIKLERLIKYHNTKDVVIFTKAKNLQVNEPNEQMCNIDDFYRFYYKNADVIFSNEDISYYVDKIKSVISTDKRANAKYINDLKKQNDKDVKDIRKMFRENCI